MGSIKLTYENDVEAYVWNSDKWFAGLCSGLTGAELDAVLSLLALVWASYPSLRVCYRTEGELADLLRIPLGVMSSCTKKAQALGKISIEEPRTHRLPYKVLSIPVLFEDSGDDDSGEKEIGIFDLIQIMRTLTGIREDLLVIKEPDRKLQGEPNGIREAQKCNTAEGCTDPSKEDVEPGPELPFALWLRDDLDLQEAVAGAVDNLYEALAREIIWHLFMSGSAHDTGRPFGREERRIA